MTVAAVQGAPHRVAASITLTLPFEESSGWHARRRLTLDLRTIGADSERIDDAVLILSELVGNALRHARPLPPGMLRVEWRVAHGEVELSVTDGGGPTEPRALRLPVSALGGRGLAIVNDLSRTWGVRHSAIGGGSAPGIPHSTSVYAILPLT